ncbi:MAG: TIGR03279 family radical SAM protein [cyanobacterium endosymbiont of Rhopalodia musculus]|uniref:TIGR03279 family radical SAM protein n=1 Tax=cyanobacterium endosymbiont of Epithemia clementina EcSB TaxID=3034674 RepID=UPI002480F671|nr:TIGR03279 family radical SAM protein [cyanobacterium endosymbiont of Epithemia clementina EcSB]WGT67675.1 TIGR03279 family radical SAM protein [cyanobacterium endosymbiont of Epithemia clementina EcSB]
MTQSSIHPAKISFVLPNSIAKEVGFEVGDSLVAINGFPLRDLIDYQFLCADEYLELDVVDNKGQTHYVEIKKDYDDDLGLEFEKALFDGLIQCNNHCPFCFIDQQPPGKRDSLYLKDDDYRLSFLYGSYLTLTNLSKKEWKRIERMRLSPLYVSVHSTEADVRIRLLKNHRAGQIIEQLKWFQKRQLQIHAQVVVCPGINDSLHLEKTLTDLALFHQGDVPTIISTAVVPVGLTRFRPLKDELIPVTKTKAKEVIKQVQSLQKEFYFKFNSNFAWLADEWFLIGQEELPPESHYEDYPQSDNGVGSISKFIREFETTAKQLLPAKINKSVTLTWVVGNAVKKVFQPLVKKLNKVDGLTIKLEALKSHYWGQETTVTGLLTGEDLLSQLQGKDLGDGILLPSIMLKHNDIYFLDDMTVEELAKQLNVKIFPVTGIEELIQICLHISTLPTMLNK